MVLKVIHVRLQDVECEILIDRHLRAVEAFVAEEFWKMREKDWAFWLGLSLRYVYPRVQYIDY